MSKLIITWILASSFGWAVSYTTISDTLLKADGTPMAGEIVVSWSTFQASDGTTVVGGTKRIRVLNGVLSTSLVSGAVYQAVYYEAGRGVARELWNVPASASPVRVADMRTILYSDSSAAAIQGVPVDPAPPAPDAVLMFDQVSGRWTARGIPSCATCVTSDQNYSDPPWLNSIAWSKVINPPVTFPPAPHTHPQADITNLVTDLAAKITTPSTAGGNGLYLRRTTDNSGWELASAASAWGSITGTLSNQTDLQSALNAKEPSISTGTTSQYWRGDKTWQTLDAAAVGLGSLANYGVASQAEAEAGVANNKYMTPLRVAQAIAAISGPGGETYSGTISLPDIASGMVGCASYTATGVTANTPLSVAVADLPSALKLPSAYAAVNDSISVCVYNNGFVTVDGATYSVTASAGGGSGSSTGGTWGTIAGDIGDQTDLQAALDDKIAEPATCSEGLVLRRGATGWECGDGLPAQGGSANHLLATNGTTASWIAPVAGDLAVVTLGGGNLMISGDTAVLVQYSLASTAPTGSCDPVAFVSVTGGDLYACIAGAWVQLAPATHTHSASAITSGTLDGARLPLPSESSLGGVRATTGGAGQFVSGINAATGELTFASVGSGYGTMLWGSNNVALTTTSLPANTAKWMSSGALQNGFSAAIILVPASGTLRDLHVYCSGTQGRDADIEFELFRNGTTATAVKATIANGQTANVYSNTSNTYSVSAGDQLSLRLFTTSTSGTGCTFGGWSARIQ